MDYSLVRRSEHSISLHRLLQTALRHRDIGTPANTQNRDRHAVVVDLLRADLPATITGAPQDWPRWRQLLPHVLAATSHHDHATPTHPDASAWLLDRAATYLQVLGQPATARPLFERALTITETAYGPDHPHTATIQRNLEMLDG